MLRRLQATGWDRSDVRGHLLPDAIRRTERAAAGPEDPDPGPEPG